ncbi:MAG TPA: thymidine phosphorylase [Acidobacteriota bacterium]|nr:thymidine phosphorylase [Acidobacteriota bacterium]
MRFVDLIESKKSGDSLTPDEIRRAIAAYVDGDVPDYQMAALLMAIRWRGLADSETVALTEAMVASGDRYDLDDIGGTLVDKHSTGGVGDKVSLILAPLAAAAGCTVPMVSGRGLGHTGGTLDKLESIPGLRTDLSATAFRDQLQHIGVAMGSQTETLVPADRRLYALRDVTGTVDDTGLITASILSKKIAEGAHALVLDVKVGRGAFFHRLEDARELADRIVAVASGSGLRCSALLTAMDQPLGHTIGNALEVAESIDVLCGGGPADLRTVTIELAAEMLQLGGIVDDPDRALRKATECLDSGAAAERFELLVQAQDGDPRVLSNTGLLPAATHRCSLHPPRSGYITGLDARAIGQAGVSLRAGRNTQDDVLDLGAGIELHAKCGDQVDVDSAWVTLHHGPAADVDHATELVQAALTVSTSPNDQRPLIREKRP